MNRHSFFTELGLLALANMLRAGRGLKGFRMQVVGPFRAKGFRVCSLGWGSESKFLGFGFRI